LDAIFSAAPFHNDDAARVYLESVLWPDGPVCPHCGVINHAFTSRPGVFCCAEKVCRKDFTVTMKTVMERSHIALHKWLQGFYLMASSKKRDERPPATSLARDCLSLGMVYVAPYPRGDARWRPCAYGRRARDRRD
jgi:hypothetical protein